MRVFKLFQYVVILGIVSVFVSCHKDPVNLPAVKGPEVLMGNGLARSYIQFSNIGIPQVIGIEMTPESMNNLGEHHKEFVLPLDTLAKALTPFNHIVINWNPHGHDPATIYKVPHFDFHFYTISNADRLRIPAYEKDSAGFKKHPGDGYLPVIYVPAGCDSQMGRHWIDPSSKEFMGEAFDHTFIYGSFDSIVNFYEPMISRDFLVSGGPFTSDYMQPVRFQKPNSYYPTAYSCGKDQWGNYYVTLSKFVMRLR